MIARNAGVSPATIRFLPRLENLVIDWRAHVTIFALVAAIIVWRRPDSLFNPQFYAEDSTWYLDAYSLGWLHALLSPSGGYLNTFPRVIASLAQLVPFRFAPLFMNLCGIATQALPVNALLSQRCANLGSLGMRALLAVFYVALPNSGEIHVTITNAQFHLALLVCLLIFGDAPATPVRKLLDLTAIILCALTGPFCVALLPLVLVFWWLRRQNWSLVVVGVFALSSVIQLYELFYSPTRTRAVLGASFQQFIRILDTQVYVAALQGRNSFASHHHFSMLCFVALVATALIAYCFFKSPLQLKFFLVFATGLFLASLQHPLMESKDPAWKILQGLWGVRYWFFPMLAFLWALVWCALTPRNPSALRWFTALLLVLSIKGIAHDWKFGAYDDRHFAQSVAALAAASPGSLIVVPTVPIPWALPIAAKGPNCSSLPLGSAELPAANQALAGEVAASGWVTGTRVIDHVAVYVDKTLARTSPLKNKRPDVTNIYPLGPNASQGWSMALNLADFPSGKHLLHFRAMDNEGCDAEFAQKQIVIADGTGK